MTDRIFKFSGLNHFLDYYQPATPEGRKDKAERKIYTSITELKRAHDLVGILISFIGKEKEKVDKISYHLKRIPLLNDRFIKGELRSELHCLKKFLHNYRSITTLLPLTLKKQFLLDFNSDVLLELLGYEEEEQESFFVKEGYSDELKDVRASLREIDIKLSRIKKDRIETIREKYSLDFRFNDFLVIDESSIPDDSETFLYIEPYDNTSVVVKPQLGRDFYDRRNSASPLYNREKELEEEILNSLAGAVEEERKSINQCVEAVKIFDISLARAEMAVRFKSIRPRFSEEGHIAIDSLMYIPLKERCGEEGEVYTPLSARFDTRHIVISGSNMGGKTIVLRSLLFAQILAQMGFFVPAAMFSTVLFQSINLIGDRSSSGERGLSSFGVEIMSLIDSGNDGNTLYIIDEFAKTTNSTEAYALNSALLESFSRQKSFWSFSSTHQENLPPLKNVSYWSMKGLDHLKYSEYFYNEFKGNQSDRIKLINKYMNYHIQPKHSGSEESRDALKIARILGLDSKTLEYAEKYLEKEELQNEQ